MLEQLLQKRHSIRNYLPHEPPREWLADLIRCGQTAPSPSNSQPVRVRQISSQDVRKQLQTAMIQQKERLLEAVAAQNGPKRLLNTIKVYYRYSAFMFTAPWLLLIGTIPTAPGFYDHLAAAGLRPEKKSDRTDQDITVGLFISAMLLRATELGLGSCILTAPLVFLAPDDTLLAFKNLRPKCFVTLGYAAETTTSTPRLDVNKIIERC
jgi:nitroreductase